MSSQTLSVEVPDLLVELLGTPEAVADGMRRALVLDLLRQARISQGRAAKLLGISRWDTLQLMAANETTSGPDTLDELPDDVEASRRARTLSGVRC